MGKSTYSFYYEKEKIVIDLGNMDWEDRWGFYGELVAPFAAPNKISEDATKEEAIVRLIEIYDKKLLSIYDKGVWLKRRKNMEKLYSSLERNLETKVNKMAGKDPLTPEHQKEIEQFKEDIIERKKKYNAKLWVDPLYIWIFNLYNFLLLFTPFQKDEDGPPFNSRLEKHGMRLFNTRLQKYIDGREKVSYTKLAEDKDPLLLEALDHVPNPQMTIDNLKIKGFIAEFLCNFEICYSNHINKHRFYFDKDDESARRSATEKIQRIVFKTYAEGTKEKLLKRLGIAYNKEKKNYDYI